MTLTEKFATTSFPLTPLAAAVLLSLWGSSPLAQTAPDVGQVLRDLQQAPALPAPKAPALQRIEETAAPVPGDQAVVTVKSVNITGNQEIPTAELQQLVASLPGTDRTLAQLHAAARRITGWYRSKGFAVARAYLPAQDVTNGIVTIHVIEGRISSHRVSNQSLLSDERTAAYLGDVKDGDVIRSDQIDRGLLLLQDTPGVSTSRATLQPGASVGTSELLIEIQASKPFNGNVVADNYGSRYTGEYRLTAALNVVSPLKVGDQLTVNALTSGDNLSFARLAYQLPVGGDGLKVGAAYFDTRYKLDKEFSALQAHGSATSASLFASYPIVRSQMKNLAGVASYEDKSLKDYVDGTATYTPKKVSATTLGLSGNLQDALGGGGISTVDLSVVLGRLSIDSATALAIDTASARTHGNFERYTYGLSRLQRFTDSTFLYAVVTGQQAGKNLDSSEKFSLGGPNAVRAYPQGEASGDEGYRATVELRYALRANLQGTLFYDWGQVTTNKTPFGAPASNSRDIAGVGFGLNASFSAVQVRSSLAWRTDGGLPTSIPASSANGPTLWLQASIAL
jgi:hemolysin activation/secretion protein